jgi:hypothetical protein
MNGMEPVAAARRIVAYRVPGWSRYLKIVPASADREWMDDLTKGWANRCLPLRIANQAGWCILNDSDFSVMWGGQNALESLRIKPKDPAQEPIFASSMFGFGILTFSIPFLFQTPPMCNLLVSGLANQFKDGVYPLTGIVESDWSPYTFTMNWKITRPRHLVEFRRDEPICMITPIPRGEMNEMGAEIRNLESAPDLLAGYTVWHEKRVASEQERRASQSQERKAVQGHYIRGKGYMGEEGDRHENKLHVKAFEEIEPANQAAKPLPEQQASSLSFWQRVRGK